ncbi:MAG: Lrp/AsnC family transcriptional regulator, partial [Vibrio sp.]
MVSLDKIDRQILDLLQADANLSLAQIAHEVHLTTSPCWKRLKRLEDEGV